MARPVHVAIDATALGSGRGGDETFMLGLLRGLAVTAVPDDDVVVYARRGAPLPDAGSWRVDRLRAGGSLRLAGPLSVRAARTGGLFVGYTHLPVGVRRPRALVVTDLSFRHHPAYYPRAARVRLNLLVPRQARAADGVVTLSEFCRRDLIASYALDPEVVHVVPCAVDPIAPLAAAEVDELRAWAARAGVDRPFLLYLGNLHPRKNVARLVRAFAAARVEGLQLVLAGGRWWRGGGEEAAVRAAPRGTVVPLGRVDERARAYLLRNAHALVYPSLFEGFGLPPLEAMSVGTPVLASDAAAIPETCGDAALLVDASDTEALVAGIVRIATDERCRARLRAAGPGRAACFDAVRTGLAARAAFTRASGRPVTPAS